MLLKVCGAGRSGRRILELMADGACRKMFGDPTQSTKNLFGPEHRKSSETQEFSAAALGSEALKPYRPHRLELPDPT